MTRISRPLHPGRPRRSPSPIPGLVAALGLAAMVAVTAAVAGPEAGANAEAGADALRREALAVLHEALEAKGSTTTGDLLSAIVTRTGQPADSVRAGLRAGLERLEAHREAADETWTQLTGLGGDQADADDVDRFLRELLDWGRKATKGRSYPVDFIVERAAGKAKVATWVGRELLGHAVAAGLSDSTAGLGSLPEKLGLRVQGVSSYPVDSGRFADLVRTDDDALNQTRFRDLHRRVEPLLVAQLPALPRVKWAVAQATPNLQPDAVLRFDIEEFTSEGAAREPMLRARVRWFLETVGGRRIDSHALDVTYEFYLEKDPEVRARLRLDGFVRMLADGLRDDIRQALAPTD